MIISLSILNIKEQDRKERIKQFMAYGNNWIHFDIMDGEFVKNRTFAFETVGKINEFCPLFKDVHLMTLDPDKYLKEYKKAGADLVTFHFESVKEEKIIEMVNKIKSEGLKAGISIKPSTNVKKLKKYLPYLDLILVMSVEPGEGGQSYLSSATKKIRWLKKKQKKDQYLISVDGGINDDTIKIVKKAGADIAVVGTYLTKDIISKDKIETLI